MDSARLRRLATLVGFAAIAAPCAAFAHHFEFPKHDHVRITASELVVDAEFAIEPGGLAQRTRSVFDSDSNGTLDDTERKALSDYMRVVALHFLKVELNGQTLDLEETGSELRGAELETSSALELTAHWTLRAHDLPYKGSNVLVLTDRHKDGSLKVPVLVTVNGETHEYRLDSREPQIRLRFKRPENRMNP